MQKKYALFLGALGLLAGIISTVAIQTHAQTTTTNNTNTTSSTSATTETAEPKTRGHAPLGGDGVISSINGTTIIMIEEADEGGASYVVDASAATITKDGAAAQISDLKVGDKIFVQGTVNGTNVKASSISLGRPEGGCIKGQHTPPSTSSGQ